MVAMKFSRLAFLFFLISIQLCALTIVQSAEPLQCESNSTYENNLRNLFSSITNDTQIDYGFYNVSYGENPDKVNAIGLCRGDLTPDSCRSCIRKATDNFTEPCDNDREGIIWSNDCMLRFSNRSIFGKMEFVHYRALIDVNDSNSTNETEFNQVLATLLSRLITQAASGDSLRKFATGDAAVSDSLSVYALVQCTPDLTQVDCNDCLYNATNLLSLCCSGKQGARLLAPSCNIRYDKDIFYGPSVAMPPAPAADAPVSPPVDAPSPVDGPASVDTPPPVEAPPSFDAPPPVEVPPPVDAAPVTSAPPRGQAEQPDIAEGNMNSGFQALATIVPLIILQDLVL